MAQFNIYVWDNENKQHESCGESDLQARTLKSAIDRFHLSIESLRESDESWNQCGFALQVEADKKYLDKVGADVWGNVAYIEPLYVEWDDGDKTVREQNGGTIEWNDAGDGDKPHLLSEVTNGEKTDEIEFRTFNEAFDYAARFVSSDASYAINSK